MNSIRLAIVRVILRFVPETRAFRMKRLLFCWAGVKLGDGVRINSSVRIIGVGRLSIGDNTWLGPDVMIACSDEITIGSNCDIAPRVYIGDGTHLITPDLKRIAGIDLAKPVHIGNGCWICVNSTVLPGVEIGNKCVVAAGAVVNRNFDDNCLIAGVPARAIKKIE